MICVLMLFFFLFDLQKRDTDIHEPFYKHVCRFLSETSLTSIAHWLHPTSPIYLPSSYLNCFISATSNKKVVCCSDFKYFQPLRWFCILLTVFCCLGFVFQVIDRTFGLSPGFYWQTVETQECVCKGRETTQELDTEVSMLSFSSAVVLPCQ